MMSPKEIRRCDWAGDDPQMIGYHDEEWGVPVHEDRKWFEYIVLDAFQAGLSWQTVLHKREAFKTVFHQFDPQRIVRMPINEIEAAYQNARIIRNRMKINATVKNAAAFIRTQEKYGSFDSFIWRFVGGKTLHNTFADPKEIPAKTELSEDVSRALKKQGFSFVGPTICYAFLQAGGVVNDHLVHCHRYQAVKKLSL